jgi:hypothetical protein
MPPQLAAARIPVFERRPPPVTQKRLRFAGVIATRGAISASLVMQVFENATAHARRGAAVFAKVSRFAQCHSLANSTLVTSPTERPRSGVGG